ncbi:hypothetical protein MMYC01_204724 [Madurella mycetomatis]|uniref:Uncharacterized protein n=1 Tax=Madurella mycetomatis TaxID=100816 RepID=A0A175W5Y7_9PEZI|nr:hypothetical protein MMYC01_204724 [Madurella mycetomatis]
MPPPKKLKKILIRNPFLGKNEEELTEEVRQWYEEAEKTRTKLRDFPTQAEIREAVTVVQNADDYESLARERRPGHVRLNDAEMAAIVKEADRSFSERGMRIVILSIGLSAFLQGFVQSSQNGMNNFESRWNIETDPGTAQNRFGVANAVVYWSAAVLHVESHLAPLRCKPADS